MKHEPPQHTDSERSILADTAKQIANANELAVRNIDAPKSVPSETVTAWLSGKLRGEIPVAGLDGSHGLYLGLTDVFEASNVYYTPEYGAVLNSRFEVYEATAAEAKFLTPDYALIPSSAEYAGTSLDEAAIFMAWGGNTNYGHFLLDCLSGAVALDRANVPYPLVSPALKPWHRDLLSLLGKECIEIAEPIVHFKKAAWSTCMDHYLHSPNETLLHVRDHILSNIAGKPGPDRIYVSRSKLEDKRRMVNEIELEERLAAEGFTIFHPQEHSIQDQVHTFRNANVVIGATGAQMANAIFMRPGAVAIEICPSNYSGIWIRNLCYLANVQWCCHYFPSPIAVLPHGPWAFSYQIDISKFVKFALECVPDRSSRLIGTLRKAVTYLRL